jgi:NAD(P)-dependent dehydrogenase (short-subunit alcohol dehydrogenase family)
MKTILVTGANKGIGLAVVEAILREQSDCKVLLGSRNLQRGQQAAEGLLSANPEFSDRLEVVTLDVGSDESVAGAVAQVSGRGTSVDGLVNNAGVADGSLAEVLNVNVHGIQRTCEAFGPVMPAGGRMVNVTSASGPNYVARCSAQQQDFFLRPDVSWEELEDFMNQCLSRSSREMEALGLPPDGHYGLSKACANVLTQNLAQRFSQLQINACTPGFIETDLARPMLGGRTPEEVGMKQPADGARVIMRLLFSDVQGSGHYHGSDGLRSPLDRYRAPGSPAFEPG